MSSGKLPMLLKTVEQARKSIYFDLGALFGFFILVASIINLGHSLWPTTIPIVIENSLQAIHQFYYAIVLYWITTVVASTVFVATWIGQFAFPIKPFFPTIALPKLIVDISMVSLALTRVFSLSDRIVSRVDREEAEHITTEEMWAQERQAEGSFWGPIHRFLHATSAKIWKTIRVVQEFVTTKLGAGQKTGTIIRLVLITLASSLLMWGIVRFVGYSINIAAAGHLDTPIIKVRKQLFTFFAANLIGAILAAVLFLVLAGYVADFYYTE